MRAASVLLASITLAPQETGAQELPVNSRCVFDTAAYQRTLVLSLWLDAGFSAADMSSRAVAARALVVAVQEEFRAPALRFPDWPGTVDSTSLIGAPRLTGQVSVDVTATGAMTYQWQSEPRSMLLKLSVDSALARGASSKGFLETIESQPPKAQRFELKLRTDEPPPGQAVILMRVRLPYLAVATPATRIGGPDPLYPRDQLATGQGGYVDLEYIVGPNGRADASSLVVFAGTSQAFVAASRYAIVNSRYEPASVAGCPVSQLVRQRISYQMR